MSAKIFNFDCWLRAKGRRAARNAAAMRQLYSGRPSKSRPSLDDIMGTGPWDGAA